MLGKLILAVVVMGILFVITQTFIDSGVSYASDETCRSSVLLRSEVAVDLGIMSEDRFFPLACTTTHQGELPANDREEAKDMIAQMATDCWYMYREGTVPDVFDADRGEPSCSVCYSFKLPDGVLEEGVLPDTDAFFEEDRRPEGKIELGEMYNYLVESDYTLPVTRGGGLHDLYVSEEADFGSQLNLADPDVLSTTEVRVTNENGIYFTDYTDELSGMAGELEDFGNNLLEQRSFNVLFVVAEEFDALNMRRMRNVIEHPDVNLNTENRYNSLLVMIDANNGVIRVQMGSELTNSMPENVLEEELNSIFRRSTIEEYSDLEGLISNLVAEFEYYLIDEEGRDWSEDTGINPDSYYAYLSNQGGNFPIIGNVSEDKGTHYIAFYSATDKLSAFEESAIRTFTSSLSSGAVDFAQGVLITAINHIVLGTPMRSEDTSGNFLMIADSDEIREACEVRD